MVINPSAQLRRRCGALMTELVVAMAILVGTLLPVAYAIASEKRLARAYYQHAVAMEIVDGEMEALLAGGWKNYPGGPREYPIHARAATNLPPGQFLVTVESGRVRLEWQPAVKGHGGPVIREAVAK